MGFYTENGSSLLSLGQRSAIFLDFPSIHLGGTETLGSPRMLSPSVMSLENCTLSNQTEEECQAYVMNSPAFSMAAFVTKQESWIFLRSSEGKLFRNFDIFNLLPDSENSQGSCISLLVTHIDEISTRSLKLRRFLRSSISRGSSQMSM